MNNLYNKIYEAVDTAIQNALIIPDGQTDDSSVIFHNKKISNEFFPCEYHTVDLKLPSGLLWCEYNLGATLGSTADEWYGNYYAWGETETKDEYSYQTYKHFNYESNVLTKYNTRAKLGEIDGIKQLELMDDAVNMTLERQFRMPTKKEYKELINNTTQEWVTNYKGIAGLNGILFTSEKNYNTLFFPASGEIYGSDNHNTGKEGFYWAADLNSNNPRESFSLFFHNDKYVPDFNNNNGIDIFSFMRDTGLSVRGVKDYCLK